MCDCRECCEDEELTKEEVVEFFTEEIAEGNCVSCTLSEVWELAYEKGKTDLAAESIEYYKDGLEEDDKE